MELKKWMTINELSEKYGVVPATIRNYIKRNQVIPEKKRIKIGRQWFIDRKFAEEKWGKKNQKQ